MENIQCVCFPRSGHHLLVNVLTKYFSKDLDFFELYGDQTRVYGNKVICAGDLCYCAIYAHCQTSPCTDKRTNFQKNHDFDLKLEMKNNVKYIVLYRDPFESIVSLYDFYLGKPYDSFLGKEVVDTPEGWKDFMDISLKYWKGFVGKWVLKNKHENVLFLDYNQMVENPLFTFLNVIKFVNPDEELDLEFLGKIIKLMKISKKRDIKKFKYYGKNSFDLVRREVREEINLLNLEN